MKIFIFILLLTFSFELFGQSNIQINREMEMIIKDFHKEINDAEVLLIRYSAKGNTDSFLVSSVVYFETISDPYPSFVFEYKNCYVCLYTGLEKYIAQPKEFKDEITKKLSPHLYQKQKLTSPPLEKNNDQEYEFEVCPTFEPYFKEYVFKKHQLISIKEINPDVIDPEVIKDLLNPN